jgi:hypothetical protein
MVGHFQPRLASVTFDIPLSPASARTWGEGRGFMIVYY